MGLSDSGYVSDFPEEINSSMTDPILALATDIFGVLWGASECSIHYLMPAKGSLWKSLDFCSNFLEETPLELHIDGRKLFLATEDHGIRVIEYNVSSDDPTSIVIERNVVWEFLHQHQNRK